MKGGETSGVFEVSRLIWRCEVCIAGSRASIVETPEIEAADV